MSSAPDPMKSVTLLPPINEDAVKANVLAFARAQVGNHEGRNDNGHWNNIQPYSKELYNASGWAYCVDGRNSALQQALVIPGPDKLDQSDVYYRSASCSACVNHYLRTGLMKEVQGAPKAGDLGFLRGGSGPHASINNTPYYHCVGANKDAVGDSVSTIEWNTNTNGSAEGDGVYLRSRQWRLAIWFRPNWSIGVREEILKEAYPMYYRQHRFMSEYPESKVYWGQTAALKVVLDKVSTQDFHLDKNGSWGPGTDSMIRWVQKNRLGDKPDKKGEAFFGPKQLEEFCALPRAVGHIKFAGPGALTKGYAWLAKNNKSKSDWM